MLHVVVEVFVNDNLESPSTNHVETHLYLNKACTWTDLYRVTFVPDLIRTVSHSHVVSNVPCILFIVYGS